MKGLSKMLVMISIVLVLGLVTWAVIAYLGRSQTLKVKGIENPGGDLYLIRLEAAENLTWEPGSYAQFDLPEVKESGQKSRFLTIASTPDEGELILLTHRSGSAYKAALTSLPAAAEVKLSWLGNHLKVEDDSTPLVCFASDIGIAALRPIVKSWAGKRPIVLSHLDKGVTVFDQELTGLADQNAKLDYSRSSSLSQAQTQLAAAADRYGNDARYLLAGQPDDVTAMTDFLKSQGVEAGRITGEQFRGLK